MQVTLLLTYCCDLPLTTRGSSDAFADIHCMDQATAETCQEHKPRCYWSGTSCSMCSNRPELDCQPSVFGGWAECNWVDGACYKCKGTSPQSTCENKSECYWHVQ